MQAFVSDESVRMSGIKMIIECRKPLSSIPNIRELYGDGCPSKFQNETIFSSNDPLFSPFDSGITYNEPTVSPNEPTTSPSNNFEFISSNDDSIRGEKNFIFKLIRFFLKIQIFTRFGI